jgi:DNA-binding beta-propeller fold protein YncE
VLKGTAALPFAAIGALESPPRAASHATPGPAVSVDESATPVPQGLIGYVFNARTQDVTLFDPVTQRVLDTKPLGAVVRWLSNEQRFWDGRSIWTYDFPEDQVRAIAIDPRDIAVSRALPTGGAAPAHSLMLTPDLKTAWVNVAGGDYLAVIDLASGEVTDEVATGKFP